MKGLNWNGIIRSPCPVSSLNEAVLRIIADRVLKRTIVVKTGDKPWFDDRCSLAHYAKQRAYRLWNRNRKQADWEKYRLGGLSSRQLVYREAVRAFTEWNKSLLTNASNARKWWSTVKTEVFGARSNLPPWLDRGGELVWSAEEKVSLYSVHFDAKQCRPAANL